MSRGMGIRNYITRAIRQAIHNFLLILTRLYISLFPRYYYICQNVSVDHMTLNNSIRDSHARAVYSPW